MIVRWIAFLTSSSPPTSPNVVVRADSNSMGAAMPSGLSWRATCMTPSSPSEASISRRSAPTPSTTPAFSASSAKVPENARSPAARAARPAGSRLSTGSAPCSRRTRYSASASVGLPSSARASASTRRSAWLSGVSSRAWRRPAIRSGTEPPPAPPADEPRSEPAQEHHREPHQAERDPERLELRRGLGDVGIRGIEARGLVEGARCPHHILPLCGQGAAHHVPEAVLRIALEQLVDVARGVPVVRQHRDLGADVQHALRLGIEAHRLCEHLPRGHEVLPQRADERALRE